MKAIILNGALLVLLAGMMVTPALAQDGGRLDRHVSYLEDRLDLTEDQVKEVEVILKDRHAEASEFKKSQRDATYSAIDQVLTDEQKGTFAEMREEMGKDMGSKWKAHGKHHGPGRMMEKLDLSDDQKSQLKTLRQEQCESMRDGFRSILTAKQFDELKELREAGKHAGGWGGDWMGNCRKQ